MAIQGADTSGGVRWRMRKADEVSGDSIEEGEGLLLGLIFPEQASIQEIV